MKERTTEELLEHLERLARLIVIQEDRMWQAEDKNERDYHKRQKENMETKRMIIWTELIRRCDKK